VHDNPLVFNDQTDQKEKNEFWVITGHNGFPKFKQEFHVTKLVRHVRHEPRYSVHFRRDTSLLQMVVNFGRVVLQQESQHAETGLQRIEFVVYENVRLKTVNKL
jgi:hypothetical protein